MGTKRSLKDAAQDPLVEKESAIAQRDDKERAASNNCVWKIVGAVILGLVGGFVSSQFLKIRL
jgi:hypothetical protein